MKKYMTTSQCVAHVKPPTAMWSRRPHVVGIADAAEMVGLVFAACLMVLPIFNISFFSLVEAASILSRFARTSHVTGLAVTIPRRCCAYVYGAEVRVCVLAFDQQICSSTSLDYKFGSFFFVFHSERIQ